MVAKGNAGGTPPPRTQWRPHSRTGLRAYAMSLPGMVGKAHGTAAPHHAVVTGGELSCPSTQHRGGSGLREVERIRRKRLGSGAEVGSTHARRG